MKKLILFIVSLCVLVTSCGGEPICDTGYTTVLVCETFSKKETDESKRTSQKETSSTEESVTQTEKTEKSRKVKNNDKSSTDKTDVLKAVVNKEPTETTRNNLENSANSITKESASTFTSETTTTEQTTLNTLADTDTAYITQNGERYHRADCHYLLQSRIKTTVGEAKKQGYTACKVCKP